MWQDYIIGTIKGWVVFSCAVLSAQDLPIQFGIPASKIVALSSGEFVGMVADDPQEKIKLKMFNAEILNDSDKLTKEVQNYKKIPVVSNVTQQQVMDNYYQVKMDGKKLIENETARLRKEREYT